MWEPLNRASCSLVCIITKCGTQNLMLKDHKRLFVSLGKGQKLPFPQRNWQYDHNWNLSLKPFFARYLVCLEKVKCHIVYVCVSWPIYCIAPFNKRKVKKNCIKFLTKNVQSSTWIFFYPMYTFYGSLASNSDLPTSFFFLFLPKNKWQAHPYTLAVIDWWNC